MIQSIIDKSMLKCLVEDTDIEFVNELIDTFLEDSPDQIADLRTAINENDNDLFRRAAHTMKSNSATFGANQLAEIAKDLEALGKAGQLEGSEVKLEGLETAYDQVESALKAWQNDI